MPMDSERPLIGMLVVYLCRFLSGVDATLRLQDLGPRTPSRSRWRRTGHLVLVRVRVPARVGLDAQW